MTEQLRFDQRFRQSRAIQRNQGFLPALAELVEPFRDQFLAGPALTHHQHRTAHRRSAAGPLDRIEEGTRLADELNVAVHAQHIAKFPNCAQQSPYVVGRIDLKGGISAHLRDWHAPCCVMNKRNSMRCNMFTKTKTKLDKAILFSVAAMLACNVIVMAQQLTSAPHYAVTPASAEQA